MHPDIAALMALLRRQYVFRLAQRRGDRDGPYCGPEGLYLGGSPLIAHFDGLYHLRTEDEIMALLADAYGSADNVRTLIPRLRMIASALHGGDLVRAIIGALHLRLGEIPDSGIARIARADALFKHNFNPDQPRDWHGRWTAEGESSSDRPISADHPAPISAKEPLSAARDEDRVPTQTAQNGPLDFSPHAWSRTQERGITADQVIDAIRNGSRVIQPNGNIRCTGAGCVVIINPSGRIVTIY